MKHKLMQLISAITICALALGGQVVSPCGPNYTYEVYGGLRPRAAGEGRPCETAAVPEGAKPMAKHEKWLPEKRPQEHVQVYSDDFFRFGSFENDALYGRLREMGIEFNPLHLLRQLNVKIRKGDNASQLRMTDTSDTSVLSSILRPLAAGEGHRSVDGVAEAQPKAKDTASGKFATGGTEIVPAQYARDIGRIMQENLGPILDDIERMCGSALAADLLQAKIDEFERVLPIIRDHQHKVKVKFGSADDKELYDFLQALRQSVSHHVGTACQVIKSTVNRFKRGTLTEEKVKQEIKNQVWLIRNVITGLSSLTECYITEKATDIHIPGLTQQIHYPRRIADVIRFSAFIEGDEEQSFLTKRAAGIVSQGDISQIESNI